MHTCMLQVFLAFSVSGALTENADELMEYENCMVCGNTFLNGILIVCPTFRV